MNPTESTRRAFLRAATLFTAGAACVPSQMLGAAPAKRRPLFDGHTLANWRPIPRRQNAPRPRADGAPLAPELLARREKVLAHTGRWSVEDGAIIGAQEPAGSGLGGYLLSEQKFGDFELEVEARPDWCVDTGIMLRADDTGGTGWQLLIDHRPNGCIGGIYGNGIGAFRCYPFVIDAETDDQRKPVRMRVGKQPDGPVVAPKYSASIEDFMRVWKPGDWNRFKVRVVGAIPFFTTWINGVKMCEVDAATLVAPGYDKDQVAAKLGSRGHLAFEVHNNGKLGNERWWPGAVCRWRNAFITEL